MAIKVYKGGSWVNATGVSAIGKADRLAIGQTNTSLPESDKLYYLSFVDDNHPYTSRQYEDFYTGIGLTFSPISQSLGLGGVLYLSGQQNNFQGSIRSYGGADKLFVLYNESAEGVISINPANSSGLNDVGIATFKRGAAAANDDSYFRSNASPTKDCSGIYNLGKPDEKWNNVYANCFHGNGTGLTGTGSWDDDDYKNLKAGTCAGNAITAKTCYNIFVGAYAGCETTGSSGAGGADQVGDSNVFLGASAGRHNVTGSYNFYGGYLAGRGKVSSSPSGSCNIFIGRSAGQEVTSGEKNVFLGPLAGEAMETGNNNIFLGLSAGRYASSASQSVAIGLGAGYCNITANNNTFLGTYAGRNVSSGGSNVAIGMNALRGQQAASGQPSCDILGIQNVAVGYAAGKSIGPLAADQGANTFLGAQAACDQLDGSFNVAIGYQVQLDLTSCTNVACVSNQLAIGAGSNRWLTGDKSFNIKPGKGIIDCTGSCGTDGQVLTSHKVAGTSGNPDNYYVKWNTNASTATNADCVKTTASTTDQRYFLTFVDGNNDPGTYEDVYTGIGITVNASNDYLYLGGSLHLDGTGADTDGDIHSWGGSDGEFAISNEGAGPIHLLVQDSDGGDAIGIVSFSSQSGNDTAARQSIFASNIYPKTTDTYNIGKSATERWNKVYANEYYGTFKGTIDPNATITLDKIEEGNTSAEVVDTGTDGHFKVLTEATERLRITSGGDVVVNHNSQDPTHSTSSGSIFLTPPSGTNPNRGIMWSNTSDTHYVKLEPGVIDGLTINGFSGVVFATGSRTGSPGTWRERFRIDSSGRIGLLDDTPNGTLKSDNFGTDNQVLTSKGPNAAAVWQTISGIPASTSNQVKVTKTSSETKLYLTGVKVTDNSEGTTVDKTLYQKTAGTPIQTNLYMDTLNNTLHVNKIRGEVVDATGKTWPEVRGNLVLNGSNFIPDSVPSFDGNGVVNGGQNIGSLTYGFANVYAHNFVGHLGGTADKAEQLEVTKDDSSETAHYFGMIKSVDETNPVAQTFYTDTALTYLPSGDLLTASNIKVTTELNVTGNTILGNQLSDTVTWVGRSGTIQPSGTTADGTLDSNNYTDKDLGSTSFKWNTVYAKTFNGAFSGTADKADLVDVSASNQNKDLSLTFIDWVSTDGDPAYKGLKFDADRNLTYNAASNVLTVPNLAITGITTLGASDSDKTIFNSKVDSNIVPAAPSSGDPEDRHNLGSETDLWGTVYATQFSGSMSGSASQVDTQSTTTIDGYVTFVENNHDPTDPDVKLQSTVYTNSLLTYNSTASNEILTVGGQLKVSKDAEFEEDVILGSGDTDDKVTFKSKIAAPLTLGIGQILPYSPANEAKTAGIDLGSGSAYWKTIYAREFKGAITGNADTATKLDPGATINLTTGSYSTTVDFSSNTTTKFTGDGPYTISAQLNSTGVTKDTYGSTTSIPQITVDAKGRITSASNKTIDLTGATADKAKQLQVTERDNYAIDYIPFVIGAPSGTATAKTFYSDDNLRYKSASDMLITSRISPDGSFPSEAGKIATSKVVNGVTTWEWGDGTASGIGRNYILPLTVSGNTATWTLTDNVPYPNTNTDPISLTAGTGLKISASNTTDGTFTISMDTSSNTAFKYKNGSTDDGTGKVAATLQIYPSGTNPTIDATQIVTITPGTGIKFTSQSAQALTIESDADLGASTVDLGKTSDINHSNPWHFVFADSRDGGSETLYVDDESPVPIKYNNDTDQLQTTNLYVTGNTILGDVVADADTVTWNAKSTTILPTNSSQNLGSQNNPWGTVYASTITGTLSINTSDKQVLYTSGTSPNALVAGSDNFTYDGQILEVADAADADNYCQLTRDGGIEICRTNASTGGSGGAYVDWRDDPVMPGQDYMARIQLATHMANGQWHDPNDRGGLLFETGGTNHRHMLLTKDGVLGITRGTTSSAILANNNSNHTIGFVPGRSRDASVAAGHNISNQVVLDVNGTLMLRRNGTSLEGGQITLNNVDDTIAYSIDVYGPTAGTSLLRIIDEKTDAKDANGNSLGRGTQRVALSRSGALGFGDVGNEDWGDSGDVLKSRGSGGIPYWDSIGSSTSGMYLEKFTSTQNNWTPPTGYSTFVFIVIGGGGGSGSADGQDDSGCDGSASGGGGGGGCSIWRYPYSSMGGTYTLTVGHGGAGGPRYTWQGNDGHGYPGGTSRVQGTGVDLSAGPGGGSNRSEFHDGGNTAGGSAGEGAGIEFKGETGGSAGGPGGSAGLNNYYGRGGHGQTVCDSPAAGNPGNGGIIIVAAFP